MSVRQVVKRLVSPPVPRHLAARHIQIPPTELAAIRSAIETHYYQEGHRERQGFSPARYERTVQNKLHLRLDSDRRLVVPWLDAARPVAGRRILEVGSGTACSTVALAEQGAEVVGIDPDPYVLPIARERARAYGITAEFHCLNATDMLPTFGTGRFDAIIFFAALEHMTIGERLAGLRDAWAMLPVSGHLVIVETPNRLWWYDGHTSLLPGYHWLPNELAFRYARFSTRENFREHWTEYDAENKQAFMRTGRGVSFHEFDLAIRPAHTLWVISSLSTYQGWRYKPQRSWFDRRWKRMLRHIYPSLHPGFCDDTLYLIIEKDC